MSYSLYVDGRVPVDVRQRRAVAYPRCPLPVLRISLRCHIHWLSSQPMELEERCFGEPMGIYLWRSWRDGFFAQRVPYSFRIEKQAPQSNTSPVRRSSGGFRNASLS